MVADQLGLPMAYVRPEPKTHGMGRQVEGPAGAGHRVVLIEDLISTGGSSIKCVEALRREGAQVLRSWPCSATACPGPRPRSVPPGCRCGCWPPSTTWPPGPGAKGILDPADLASLAEWRADTAAWSRRFEQEPR